MRQKIDQMKFQLLNAFPKRSFSLLLRRWSALSLPWPLRRLQTEVFCTLVSLNTEESARPVTEYKTLDALFTRELKCGVRPIEADPQTLISPADSTLESHGSILQETLIQAKGIEYDLQRLLNGDPRGERFANGSYITLYLSPHDYHRVHFPVSGAVVGFEHIPGTLFPVGTFSRNTVPSLYARNERVVTYIETQHGLVAVVMVAAMGVGNMTLSYDTVPLITDFGAKVPCTRGEELGVFHLGSTVVLLFEEGRLDPLETPRGTSLTMGSTLAHWSAK